MIYKVGIFAEHCTWGRDVALQRPSDCDVPRFATPLRLYMSTQVILTLIFSQVSFNHTSKVKVIFILLSGVNIKPLFHKWLGFLYFL